jgi:hypothetical protein
MSLFDDRAERKVDLKTFIRCMTCSKYNKVLSSCDRYWVIKMKSIQTQMKFKTCNHFSINKNVTTNMICRIMIFCSTFDYYFTSKNRLKIFKLVNVEIFLNRAFKRLNFDKSCVVTLTFFRFREMSIFCFWNTFDSLYHMHHHVFNNWWRTFIIIISWIFIKSCF